MSCQVCGAADDPFSAATQEPACSICVIRFGLGPISSAAITVLRERLGLAEGEYFQRDRGATVRRKP